MAKSVQDCGCERSVSSICDGEQRLLRKPFWNSCGWVRQIQNNKSINFLPAIIFTGNFLFFFFFRCQLVFSVCFHKEVFRRSVCFLISDHALVGHDILSKAVVVDDFKCLQKCIANRKCKSLNVHPSGNKSEFICELNNKARKMMPDAFQRKQGSTYYGSVEASDYGLIHDHL